MHTVQTGTPKGVNSLGVFIVSYKLNTNTGDKKYYNDCREFYVIHCYNNIKEMKKKNYYGYVWYFY